MNPILVDDENRVIAGFGRVLPFEMRRRGVESKIIMPGKEQAREPDPELIKAIKDAHRWFAQIARGEATSVREIARTAEIYGGDVSRYMRLAFLVPDIVEAILSGNHPIELTAEQLKRCPRIPRSWSEQRMTFGFTPKVV